MNLDVLAFAAHPDDVELCAGGTMCLLAQQGYRTGIVDLTLGELGTRGTPELRKKEAQKASDILGLLERKNLGLPDGGISNTRTHQLKIIEAVRSTQPHIILINSPEDRHPDHKDAADLVISSLFYAGLVKLETRDKDGTLQDPWRPDHVLHYMQTIPFDPTLVVDVSTVWEQRMEAIQAFESQFFNPAYQSDTGEPVTYISTPAFFDWIEARARTYGQMIGAQFGEPFLYHQSPFGVTDLVTTLSHKPSSK